jgi:hypothetical protein
MEGVMPDDPVKGGYLTTERHEGPPPARQVFWVLKVYTRHDDLYVRGVYTCVEAMQQDCADYRMRGVRSRSLPVGTRT